MEAYVYGRQQMKDQLAKNRCATSIFDSSTAAPEAERPGLFGSPKKHTTPNIGATAYEGHAMYVENHQKAIDNKLGKEGRRNPIKWEAPRPPSALPEPISATAGMESYAETKRVAALNKQGAKGGGNPIKWNAASAMDQGGEAKRMAKYDAEASHSSYLENRRIYLANKDSAKGGQER